VHLLAQCGEGLGLIARLRTEAVEVIIHREKSSLERISPPMAGTLRAMAGRQQLVRVRSDNESCSRKVGTRTARERCSC